MSAIYSLTSGDKITTFKTIFRRVIGSEGGFTDNPKDPGNWTGGKVGKGELKGTKFGLAAHSHPDLDIKNITVEQAEHEYYKWFLDGQLHLLPPVMQYQMFDARFNHGAKWANKLLQRAVGAKDDGIIGPKTLAAVNGFDRHDLPLRFVAYRVKFYTDLRHFDEFGRGWMRRIHECLMYASQDN